VPDPLRPVDGLRPVEGLASAAFLLAGVFWLLALLFAAFGSGWAWAFALGWGALAFALGLPFGLLALLQGGRATSPVLVRSLLASLGTLAASLGVTWLLVTLDAV
jgi:hypothetical protein